MKKILYVFVLLLVVLSGCQDDDSEDDMTSEKILTIKNKVLSEVFSNNKYFFCNIATQGVVRFDSDGNIIDTIDNVLDFDIFFDNPTDDYIFGIKNLSTANDAGGLCNFYKYNLTNKEATTYSLNISKCTCAVALKDKILIACENSQLYSFCYTQDIFQQPTKIESAPEQKILGLISYSIGGTSQIIVGFTQIANKKSSIVMSKDNGQTWGVTELKEKNQICGMSYIPEKDEILIRYGNSRNSSQFYTDTYYQGKYPTFSCIGKCRGVDVIIEDTFINSGHIWNTFSNGKCKGNTVLYTEQQGLDHGNFESYVYKKKIM